MPTYPFRCSQCGQEFEVSRPMSRASDPAQCPKDGAPAGRVFTSPIVGSRSGDLGGAPMPPPPPSGGHGHSHGPGSHSH